MAKQTPSASALHIREGNTHSVAIDSLRVLVNGNDKAGWMAQGMEINYFVCGKTEKSVKDNFVKGLMKTIGLYLDEDGNIKGLCKAAPQEVWEEFYEAASDQQKTVSFVTLHNPIPVSGHGINEVAFLCSRTDNDNGIGVGE